jgi:hypothetical protein
MVMHFQIQLTREAQRYLYCYLGGANFILTHSHPISYFIVHPKTTFMTTLLRSSVCQPQSAQLHIVRNNGDLRSKDLAGVPLETN